MYAKLASIGIRSNNSMYACLFPITESDFDVHVHITSITVSLLVFAILTFVIGFLLGALLVKYIMKSSRKDKVVSVPMPGSMPLYEEIIRPPSSSALTSQEAMKIEDNEAYGCI